LSTPPSSPRSDENPAIEEDHHGRKASPETTITLFRSLWNYALVGGAASLVLSLIELIDVNFRLAPEFQSLIERTIFGAYFSLDIAGGLLIGLFVGLCVHAASLLKRTVETVLARRQAAKPLHKVAAGATVCAIAAILLNQQPQVHGYVLEIIREAEKFESFTVPLLNHEKSTSYLMLMAFVVGCSVLWMITRALYSAGSVVRGAWIAVVIVMIACGYYVDSRFEPLLYTTSVHRSMFLFDTALSMSLVATIFSRSRNASAEPARESRRGKTAAIGVAIVLVGLVVFTFARFDKNQNLKTLLFYRTTQAKQYFKLTQWVLDFDRDGYSALLGGGDCDDRRADVNPGHREILDDGIDHNCIGGALTKSDLEDWNREHTSLHQPPDSAAKRFNVIYVFVDAMRADHLSAYSYSRKTSPNLDKLASRSSLFENAFTPAPNTFEALPKFTQGAYWDAHLEAWPEILARNGYDALLFPRRIATLRRHVKGMKIVDSARVGTFKETIDAAIAVLGGTPKDRPFCAYLYSTDTHRPYRPHDESNYGSSTTDLYDGEVSYVDFHLGRLFDSLEQSGRLDDTIIVIMADHGESLGERGVYKHSSQLYNEQTHVPLIIHFPGVTPRSIRDYVSTIDLGPTILNAVGLDYPKECAGVSLMPLVRGQHFEHPPIYGEQTTQEVSPFVRPDQNVDPELKKYMIITQDGFKLIYNRDYYSFELYDLTNDPREIRNLYDRMPDKAADLRNRLGRFIDVVTVSRPWDADEGQYVFGPTGEPREAK
jgi:arylsulfatase A-like enzyme